MATRRTKKSVKQNSKRKNSRLVSMAGASPALSDTASVRSGRLYGLSVILVFGLIAFVAFKYTSLGQTLSDRSAEFADRKLQAIGFKIEHINVTGEGQLNEADIKAAIGITPNTSFF